MSSARLAALHINRKSRVRSTWLPGCHLAERGPRQIAHGICVLDHSAELGQGPHEAVPVKCCQRTVPLERVLSSEVMARFGSEISTASAMPRQNVSRAAA